MKIMYTSAMIPLKKEERIAEYQKAYNQLIKFFKKEDISVIECYANDANDIRSILNCENVFVTKTHRCEIRNKGVLEILGMMKFLNQSQIDDNDILLKITGRYILKNTEILQQMLHNDTAFVGKLVDNNLQVFTGCFLIRKNVLCNFFNSVNLDHMEKHMINFERTLKDYLFSIPDKSIFLDTINVEAPIFGTGNVQTYHL
jgi:hypothetical protein